MTRIKLSRDEKLALAKRIYEDFGLSFNKETQSYYFLKLDIQKNSKEFRSLEEGLEVLLTWLNKGIINFGQKLDLINILVKTNLPHIFIEPGITITRRSFCLRSYKVTATLADAVATTKEKIKPKEKPKPGQL